MWRLCRCMPNRFNHIRLIIIIYTLSLERIMYRIGIKNAIFTLCKGWHFLCNIIYVTFHNIFYNIFKIFLIVFLLIIFAICPYYLSLYVLHFFNIFCILYAMQHSSIMYFCLCSLRFFPEMSHSFFLIFQKKFFCFCFFSFFSAA